MDTRPPKITIKFYLSDSAYETLLKQAHQLGFIKNTPQQIIYAHTIAPARGFGDRYLDWLATQQHLLIDTRPQRVKDNAYKILTQAPTNTLPPWHLGSTRLQRTFRVYPDTLSTLANRATQLGIISQTFTDVSQTGLLLEAIGVGYVSFAESRIPIE